MQDYFRLFKLPPQFSLDLKKLETNYRAIQSASHPDRFVSATAAEKLSAMQTATLANEAYQTLKKPASRAQYLLKLEGIDAVQETNTTMPAEFLMQQMEWREQLDDAKNDQNILALESLLKEMQQAASKLQQDLTQLFDEKNDLTQALDATRKLIFIDKVCADINKAIEHLE